MKPPALVFAADSLEKKSKCVLNDVDFLFRAVRNCFGARFVRAVEETIYSAKQTMDTFDILLSTMYSFRYGQLRL